MSQFKDHPFVEAMNVVAPIILPSFEVRSIRDDNGTIVKKPVFDYVINSIVDKTYDKTRRKWRATYNIILMLSVLETRSPVDGWCKYEELKDAQNRQALFYRFNELLQDFIVMLINPAAASGSISNNDTIYSKYDFEFVLFRDGAYFNKKGKQNLTGIAIDFDLSCFVGEQSICCVDDGSASVAEKLQSIVKSESVSFKKFQKIIDNG